MATDYQPGIYPNMSWDEYRAIPYTNCSTLQWGKVSMMHLKAAIDGRLKREDSPALAFGRALHLRLLEPDLYQSRVVVCEPCQQAIKTGPRKGDPCGNRGLSVVDGEWRCGTHGGSDCANEPGIEVLTQSESDAIERAAAAVRNHPAEKLRRAKGHFEVTVIADLCGRRIKGRLDKLIESPLTIVDVKKVAAPNSPSEAPGTPAGFERRIAAYGYGMQAALYCDLVAAVTGSTPRWFWLPVEDGEPYSVGAYRATERLLNAGRNEYMNLLLQLVKCEESGNWPGYSQSVIDIDGPDWWVKQNGGEA